MFGTDDNSNAGVNDPAMLDNVTQLAKEPADIFQATQVSSSTPPAIPPVPTAQPWTGDDQTNDDVTNNTDSNQEEPANAPTPLTPIDDLNLPQASQTDDSQASTPTPREDVVEEQPETPNSVINTTQLADLKQQALSHLEPLVGSLDQTPEEEFRTTMMMIQANDNHKLIEKALKSAKNIKDDTLRAQAMLDIINEVNYFTHLASEVEEQ